MHTFQSDIQRTESPDFTQYLRNELISRCNKNDGYSLRAFARQLGVNHATLSSIMAGKRPLTRNTIIKLGKALKLNPTQLENFLKRHESTNISHAQTEHQCMALDTFMVISEWYHDAILELTHTKNFKPDIRWISHTLGITTTEVRSAIDRLERLELLEISDNVWTDLSRNNTTNMNNSLSSQALRNLQAKILELSQKALADLPRTQRDHTSLIVAMHSSDLEEVKERIKRFRFELVNFIERKKAKPDAVYQFAFSVFPITKNRKNNEENL